MSGTLASTYLLVASHRHPPMKRARLLLVSLNVDLLKACTSSIRATGENKVDIASVSIVRAGCTYLLRVLFALSLQLTLGTWYQPG